MSAPRHATSEPILSMRSISVHFGGITALSEVALDVPTRGVTGVIGPNGAGKTTLFNVACGLTRATTGTVHWRGEDVTRLSVHRRSRLGIARTLQGLGLYAGMSVVENVMVGLDTQAKSGFWAGLLATPRSSREERLLRNKAMDTLADFGVAAHARSRPESLPYGLRKRVALARAVIADPALLMLDEPASGLSESEMDELADLIVDLGTRMTVMLVEHHMDLVMRACDQILVLDFGRVIAQGAPSEVQNDPAVVAAYLGNEVPAAETGIGGPA